MAQVTVNERDRPSQGPDHPGQGPARRQPAGTAEGDPQAEPGPGRIDGLGGQQTKAAVLAFQGANGLAADAIVGPQTWGKLIPFGS